MKKSKWCQTAKGPYIVQNPSQGSVVANNPMYLLCIDFMKVDHSKDGKENVIFMTDALSKLSVAVITPNQQVKTVPKALIDKWFITYGTPLSIHSDEDKSFDSEIMSNCAKWLNNPPQHNIILAVTHQ